MNIYLKNKLTDQRGAALIIGYIVLFALVSLSSSVALFNFTDLNHANRFRDSSQAFWLAEAGINDFLKKPDMLDQIGTITYPLGRGTVYLTKDDSRVTKRIVTSIGSVKGIKRSIQIEYPSSPGVFDQTMSVSGDLLIKGKKSTLAINDKLLVSGKVEDSARHSSLFFEDLREGINPASIALNYPDINGNGIKDEFSDFIQFNRNLMRNYHEDEVVYLRGNNTFIITPDPSMVGKKIIYVEGDEGKGDVTVQFSGAWPKNQNLTIISTGKVTNNLAGMMGKDTQLNIIAWSGYKETAVLPSSHTGVIFTHGKAEFDEIHDTSITSGSIIAGDGVVINEVWSTKTFNYVDTRDNGAVPPGFEGLIGGGVANYAPKPNSWKEVMI